MVEDDSDKDSPEGGRSVWEIILSAAIEMIRAWTMGVRLRMLIWDIIKWKE